MRRFLRVVCALCVVLAVAGANAYADTFSIVSTRPGADTIDWGQFGVTFTTFASPGAWTSNLGATGTVSDGGTLERRDQGHGWTGNFTNGDHLLWNQNNRNTINLAFNAPIMVGGAQMNADAYGPFNACVQATGSFGLSPVICMSGNVTSAGDGSAPFIGITDLTGPNITGLLFTTDVGPNYTAINQVSFDPVPEPATLLLFGSGLVGLIRRRWVA